MTFPSIMAPRCLALLCNFLPNFTKWLKVCALALHRPSKRLLHSTLEELPSNASACHIQQTLRPFIGPSNKLRQGMPPLPAIRNADGELCRRPEDTVNRWIEHFAAIEGGVRLESQQQRQEWITEPASPSVVRTDLSN